MVVNFKRFTENFLNSSLHSNYIRMYVMLLCGVLIGYTLYPVPPWLSELFNTSYLLKFLILFFTGITAVYPVNGDELFMVFVCSAGVLLLFEILRQFKMKNEKEN